MAPSRRRGASKAAAAAAARRQWKVGDLVLAKVKGFPAWPATVSEPEKWGYKADWRKVLVFFFGTQQIAFCNHADVEAFTEEKKQSLLTKRQGKGADFVRAVKEIIESYEKSKKQDQVDDFNSGDEATLANGGNSMESSAHFELRDRTETSEATVSRNDFSFPTKDAPDTAQVNSLQDKEALLEKPTDDVVVTGKSIITTYTSRKRSGVSRSRKPIMQKRALSGERSRSTSQLESCRFQNLAMPSSDVDKTAVDISSSVIPNGSPQRNKRIKKLQATSKWDDVHASACVSNSSIEDNGSEIVTADSDSCSLNEGSTVDSGCELEHSEAVVECLDGDVELSKGIDFEIKAVLIKKKRKPNRKRLTNETAEPSARLETEAAVEVGVHNSSQSSQNASENLNKSYNKEDGDEHLPLVKRARVRMGKLSVLEDEHNSFSLVEEKAPGDFVVNPAEQHNSICQAEEEKPSEVAVNPLEQTGLSTSSNDDTPADRDSYMVKGALCNDSPRTCAQIPGNRSQLLRENHSFGCSPDGEAALPPSKRLHRALEAMSENVAETLTMKTLINDNSVSLTKSSVCVADESEEGNGSGEQSEIPLGGRVSAFCSSPNVIFGASVKSDICDRPTESSKCQEPSKSVILGPMDHEDGKYLGESCIGTENPDEELDTSQQVGLTPNHISLDGEAAKLISENGTNVSHYSEEDAGCGNTKPSTFQTADNIQANRMCDVAKDVKDDQIPKEASCLSDDNLGDKDMLGIQSMPFSADRIESPAQLSPPTTSVCHVSTSESANFVQNHGCSTPNIHSHSHSHLHRKKIDCTSVAEEQKVESVVPQGPKSDGKWSNNSEAHDALSSFEGTLGSLTRTKESIGRATRIAIDCAKLGVSSKVVEILTRTLEGELILHRRIDLFFLVDSISQCSRGLKGDVGGIYPSAIQAVLPRLLAAAAPPGSFAQENRRQCLKVLRLWLERRILPESVIRHHMRELDSLGGSSSAGPYSRRSARTERALDDPVRDMEGMLVDEYGSNSSFQLPGFCMPRMIRVQDEGSDSDGGSFEAVTPEHNTDTPEEVEAPAVEKQTHILEDVDGELEMEDVAPSCEIEMGSNNGIAQPSAAQNPHNQIEQHFSLQFAPPLPRDVPPSSPPLPSSPPPLPPPPPPPPAAAAIPPSCASCDPYTNAVESTLHANSYNIQDDLRRSAAQQPIAPRFNPSMSNPANYHASECRDQMQMQLCDSNGSFDSYPMRPMNNAHHADGQNFHHKAYPPKLLHHPPSNQFGYVQCGHHTRSRRETPQPPSYPHRFHSSHDADGGNFYNNHERMRPPPYEVDDRWRYHAPPYPGPRYSDRGRASYAPDPYGVPPREPSRTPHQGWGFPPRGMHHRNFPPYRTPSEGPIPVSSRGPIWRPR